VTAWSSQIFGADALTAFAVAAREVDTIEFGTAVIPIHPRHPQVLAQQALTVQAIAKGRLTLGIGLSHQVVVEGLWGYPFESPAGYMREYLEALVPMLQGESVHVTGGRVHAITTGPVGVEVTAPPSLMVAALGPKMLAIAGEMTDGTITWMTGVATLRDYIVPTLAEAASRAGRPAPKVAASLPVCCTSAVATASERIDKGLAMYPTLPSYKAMMDREGATLSSEIGLIGSKERLADGLAELAAAGVTDFNAAVMGSRDEQAATVEVLTSLMPALAGA
jgi:F420-dependent oxidoreductase-like protein